MRWILLAILLAPAVRADQAPPAPAIGTRQNINRERPVHEGRPAPGARTALRLYALSTCGQRRQGRGPRRHAPVRDHALAPAGARGQQTMANQRVRFRPRDDSFIMPLLRYQSVRAAPTSACPTSSPLRLLLRRPTTDGRGRPRLGGLCDRVCLWSDGDLLVRAPGGPRAPASPLFGRGPQPRERRVVECEPVWPPPTAGGHRLEHAC